MAITLEAGDRAPAFTLKDQDGNVHRLRDYRGRTVVLYFYPRDSTSGCTTQACSLRDANDDIAAKGAAGPRRIRRRRRVSPAVPRGAPPALSAVGRRRREGRDALRSWGEKTLYGRKSIGMTRSTFIIGPDGKLLRVWKRARAAGHGETVLKALRALVPAA